MRRLAPLAVALWCGGCHARLPGLARDRFVAPVDVLEVRWRRHLTEDPLIEYKPQEFASADSDGTRVFIGSSAKVLWALAARDGRPLWKRQLPGAVSGQPRWSAETGLVYVGCDDGGLYALEAESGKERWVYHTRAPVGSQPVVTDGVVYFSTGENRVYAIDAASGKWRWQYDREAPESFAIRGYAAPLVVAGRLYAGFADGYLACLDTRSGDVFWARSLAGDATRFLDVDSTPILYRGTLFVAAYGSGVYALDPKDGSVRWRYEVEGASSVRAADDRLFFASAKAGLHALDLEGHRLWRQSLAKGGELSPPTLVGPYVMVSSAVGGTYVADAATGHLYQYFSPGHGVTAAPVSDGRQVYVLSNGGYFYALRLAQR